MLITAKQRHTHLQKHFHVTLRQHAVDISLYQNVFIQRKIRCNHVPVLARPTLVLIFSQALFHF